MLDSMELALQIAVKPFFNFNPFLVVGDRKHNY